MAAHHQRTCPNSKTSNTDTTIEASKRLIF
jgi:hypothetical protein